MCSQLPLTLHHVAAAQYDRTALIAAVAEYVAHADATQAKATIRGYSKWVVDEGERVGSPRLPSAGTVRARLLREQSWSELVANVRKAALEASAALSSYWEA